MTIEEEALKMEVFLAKLHKELLAREEFRSLYTETGRLDDEIVDVLAALKKNRRDLREARRKIRLHPGIDKYKQDENEAKLGLEGAILEGQKLWNRFRESALNETEHLEEEAKEKKAEFEEDAFNRVMEGLREFRDFLRVSADIKGATKEWAPVIASGLAAAARILQGIL